MVLLFFIYCNTCYSSTSSSFLISQTAFNNYDFSQVLYQYNNEKFEKFKDSYLDELIAAVITEDTVLASSISKQILQTDPNNKEARLFEMVDALRSNNKDKLKKHRLDSKKNKNELFEFLFFNGEQINKNYEVSQAFVEIIRSSYSNKNTNYFQNYNFLLFYSSLSILTYKNNFEATFIKGQLLQIIEKYIFAETTYLRIPKISEYFLDAQKNIALNYSKENGYKNPEKKILKIIEKNKEDYQLIKILADFYRVEKKYKKAIIIYSDLFKEKREDNWYILYLRGICHERSGDWKKAEIDFLKSLKLNPNSANVLNYLAYGWIERNIKINQSFEMLTEAYNSDPESYYILDSLAWAHFKKKEYKKAAELMEKVIDKVPGEAISLDHLGDIYFAMNRKREAIYFWKQAKDLAKPEDEIANKVEEKLRSHNDR